VDVESIFNQFNNSFEADSQTREEIKKHVKDFDAAVRSSTSLLQQLHSHINNIPEILIKSKQSLAPLREIIPNLQKTIDSKDSFYKYRDHWRFSVSRYITLITEIHWLETKTLLSVQGVEQSLNISPNSNFRIEIEDYLSGVVTIPNDLSRLCVNCVTAGNYELPLQISKFVSDLFAGFRLLNLKNNDLRNKYDSIKYDMKKIEEVVYDISIRGLAKKQ